MRKRSYEKLNDAIVIVAAAAALAPVSLSAAAKDAENTSPINGMILHVEFW